MKKIIKILILSIPFVGVWFYKKIMLKTQNDIRSISSKLLHLGHSLDLFLVQGKKVPLLRILEIQCLINIIKKKQIPLNKAERWALEKYYLVKNKIRISDETTRQHTIDHNEIKLLQNIIKSRRSIRKWNDNIVEVGELEKIIEIAKWAPSSCNRQPWQILLLNRQEDKEFLSSYFPNKFWISAPYLLIVLINTKVYSKNESHFAYLDGACFVQNLLLLFHCEDFGACWIGFKGWNNNGDNNLHPDLRHHFYERFHLSPDFIPISMIAVGRTDQKTSGPERKDLQSILIKHDIE